jgi:hypothetical protein
MAMADMVARLGLDSSGFIAPIEEAIVKLNSLAAESQASFQKLAASTAPAESAARNLAATQEQSSKAASQAVEKQHTSLIGFALKSTGVLSLFASGIALFDPKFKKYAIGLSLVSIAHKIYQATIGASAEAAKKAHAAMSEKPKEAVVATSAKPGGAQTESNKNLISSTLEVANVMAQRAVFATIMYKAGLDEIGSAVAKNLSLDSKMMRSISGIASSFASAANTGIDMFAEGIKASGLAVLQAITGFGDLTEIVDFGASKITQAAKYIGTGMSYVSDNARELGLQVGAFLGSVQSSMSPLGDGMFNSQKYIEEGRQLNKLIEETARHQQAIDAQTQAYKTIKDAEESASRGRQLAIDKSRIGSIQTVAGIDAELQALKVKQAFMDKDVQKSKEYLKYISNVTQALENQRTTLMAGDAKPEEVKQSEASKSYEAAQQSLTKLQMGQEAYARAAIMAMDATDDEVVALLALHDQTVALDAAQKQQQKTDQLFTQGANKITDMKDQIDLLTGAATAAEIEMRKLSRAGYDEKQIKEIGRLTEQTEKLRAKDKAGGSAGTDKATATQSKASFAGSSETASLFLRGVGGDAGGVQQKQLKAQELMLAELKISNLKTSAGSQTQTITANVV